MGRVLKNATIFLLIVMFAISMYTWGNKDKEVIDELNVTEFNELVLAGEVEEISIVSSDTQYAISGVRTDRTKFELTTFPDMELEAFLAKNNVDKVEFKEKPPQAWWITLLATLLPMLLIVGLLIFLMQQGQGGGGKVMQFGKSRAKLNVDDRKKVTFKDVAGVDEVQEELEEIVEFLRDPRKFLSLGARIPKGVLLYGPPGTGKTLLARAVAGEAGVPFFSISGSDFVEMFVGVGASRVRDLFDQAKKSAPCIIFIDEIDAVGRQRGAGLGGGHDEREQTLNQLLVEMDGFSANESIIVMAATNRPDILDPALLRPGRFDREITVDVPDVRGREEILLVHAKGKPIADHVDFGVLARRTPGFTGADLANVINEAALLAARKNKKQIEMSDMEAATERVIAGPEKKSHVISDKEKKIVSYHEAGHAVVSYFLPNADPVHKISIIPRGRAGGYTLHLPQEDRRYSTKSYMLDQLVIFLGGRLSEELVLKDVSTGASNDLERATEIVRQMITRYGMSKELGPLTFGKNDPQTVFLGRDISQERNYSEAIAYAIDREAHQMMEEAYNKGKKILTDNMDKLHAVAAALSERETLEADDFDRLMRGEELEPLATATDDHAGTASSQEEATEQCLNDQSDCKNNRGTLYAPPASSDTTTETTELNIPLTIEDAENGDQKDQESEIADDDVSLPLSAKKDKKDEEEDEEEK
ncbi:MAG: ATP-dependent zinc metalloprotease FtsH [Bacillota bacterium]